MKQNSTLFLIFMLLMSSVGVFAANQPLKGKTIMLDPEGSSTDVGLAKTIPGCANYKEVDVMKDICDQISTKLKALGATVKFTTASNGPSNRATEIENSKAAFALTLRDNPANQGEVTNIDNYDTNSDIAGNYLGIQRRSDNETFLMKIGDPVWPHIVEDQAERFEPRNDAHGYNDPYYLTKVHNPTIDKDARLKQSTIPYVLASTWIRDYQPVRHRALSDRWRAHKAVLFFRGIVGYLTNNTYKEEKGYIIGVAKSGDELVTRDRTMTKATYNADGTLKTPPAFYYINGTHDQYVPLNGATVKLYKGDSKTALQTQTVDNNYNGIFYFPNLEPGVYRVEVIKEGYITLMQNVAVEADETTYTTFLSRKNNIVGETLSNLDLYFNWTESFTELKGVIRRSLVWEDHVIVLTHEDNAETRTAHLYAINHRTKAITEMSTKGIVAWDKNNKGDYLALSDIALTEDGKLIGCNYITTQYGPADDDSYVETGYKRGELRFYRWQAVTSDPLLWQTLKGGTGYDSHTNPHCVNRPYADMGFTMAVNGTTEDCMITVTGVNHEQTSLRYAHIKIEGGKVMFDDSFYTKSGIAANIQKKFLDVGKAGQPSEGDYRLCVSPFNPEHAHNRFVINTNNTSAMEFSLGGNAASNTVQNVMEEDAFGLHCMEQSYVTYQGHPIMAGVRYGLKADGTSDELLHGARIYDISQFDTDGKSLPSLVTTNALNWDLTDPDPTRTDEPKGTKALADHQYANAMMMVENETDEVLHVFVLEGNTLHKYSTYTETQNNALAYKADRGIFAYDLRRKDVHGDHTAYQITFHANAEPIHTHGDIVMYKDGKEVHRHTYSNVKKDLQNTIDVNMQEVVESAHKDYGITLQPGDELTWGIELKQNKVRDFTLLKELTPKTGTYTLAYSAIDRSPESSEFARLYVMDNASDNNADGLYVYQPTLELVSNQGTLANANLNGSTGSFTGGQKGKWVTPGRMTVDKEGNLYIPESGAAHKGIWRATVSQKSGTYAQMFTGSTSRTTTARVYNDGEHALLFTYNLENNDPLKPNTVAVYRLGSSTGKMYSTISTPQNVYDLGLGTTEINGNVWPTSHGFFVCLERTAAQNTQATPSLMFFDYNGEKLYSSENNTYLTDTPGAAMCFSSDERKLMVATTDNKLVVFHVIWDGDTPTLTYEATYDATTIGIPTANIIRQLTLDYAGNLLISGDKGTYYCSLPSVKPNIHLTPAQSTQTLIVPGSKTAGDPAITWGGAAIYAANLKMYPQKKLDYESYVLEFTSNENATAGFLVLYENKTFNSDANVDARLRVKNVINGGLKEIGRIPLKPSMRRAGVTQSMGDYKLTVDPAAETLPQKGQNYYEILGSQFPSLNDEMRQELAWAVELTSKPITDMTQLYTFAPNGTAGRIYHAVDKSPSSPYFGRMYAVYNAEQADADTETATKSKNGVYIFDHKGTSSDYYTPFNGTLTRYTGGNTDYLRKPLGMAIDRDGRVYLADAQDSYGDTSTKNHVGVYLLDPAKPTANFTSYFKGRADRAPDDYAFIRDYILDNHSNTSNQASAFQSIHISEENYFYKPTATTDEYFPSLLAATYRGIRDISHVNGSNTTPTTEGQETDKEMGIVHYKMRLTHTDRNYTDYTVSTEINEQWGGRPSIAGRIGYQKQTGNVEIWHVKQREGGRQGFFVGQDVTNSEKDTKSALQYHYEADDADGTPNGYLDNLWRSSSENNRTACPKLATSYGGGFALTNDESQVITFDKDKNFQVHNITWHIDNVKRIRPNTITYTNISYSGLWTAKIHQMSFDFAGNLIVSGANGSLAVFSYPKANNTCVTPAREPIVHMVSQDVTANTNPTRHIFAYDLRVKGATEEPVAGAKCIEPDDKTKSYTFSFISNEDATKAELVFYNGNDYDHYGSVYKNEIGRIHIDQPVKREQKTYVTVHASDLPNNGGDPMAWAVELTAVPALEMGTRFTHKRSAKTGVGVINNNPHSPNFTKLYTYFHTADATSADKGFWVYTPNGNGAESLDAINEPTWSRVARMGVDTDGNIYVSDKGVDNPGVFVGRPDGETSKLNFTSFFDATTKVVNTDVTSEADDDFKKYYPIITTTDGKEIGSAILSCSVYEAVNADGTTQDVLMLYAKGHSREYWFENDGDANTDRDGARASYGYTHSQAAVAQGKIPYHSILFYELEREGGKLKTTWNTLPSVVVPIDHNRHDAHTANLWGTKYGFFAAHDRAAGQNDSWTSSIVFYDRSTPTPQKGFHSGDATVNTSGVVTNPGYYQPIINGSLGGAMAIDIAEDGEMKDSGEPHTLVLQNASQQLLVFDITWVHQSGDIYWPELKLRAVYRHNKEINQMHFDFGGNLLAMGPTGVTEFVLPNPYKRFNRKNTPAMTNLLVTRIAKAHDRVFVGGAAGDGDGNYYWSDPNNWEPKYLPEVTDSIRIENNCVVNFNTMTDPEDNQATPAWCKYIDLVREKPHKLIITPDGSLTVYETIRTIQNAVDKTRALPAEGDILVEAKPKTDGNGNPTGEAQNGVLVQYDRLGKTKATVQICAPYSQYDLLYNANNEPVSNKWHFAALPFAYNNYNGLNTELSDNVWLSKWHEDKSEWEILGGYVEKLDQFTGYLLLRDKDKHPSEIFTLTGDLAPSGRKRIDVTCLGSDANRVDGIDYNNQGANFLGNSWTAPLDISYMSVEDDFKNVNATVYIYRNDMVSNASSDPDEGIQQNPYAGMPGYYEAWPVAAAAAMRSMNIDQHKYVVNPLQGFFVLAQEPHTAPNDGIERFVNMDYTHVMVEGIQPAQNQIPYPRAAMGRRGAYRPGPDDSDDIPVNLLRIDVKADNGYTGKVTMLESEKYTLEYDNGYDGKTFVEGMADALPYLAAASVNGDMAVLATPSLSGTFLNFRQGRGCTEHTFTFTYNGFEDLLLEDALAGDYAEIYTGNTYTFTATDDDSYRFRIVRRQQAPDVPSDLPNVYAYDDKLYLTNPSGLRTEVCIYSADGRLVQQVITSDTVLPLDVPATGVYTIRLSSEQGVRTIKHIM